MRSNQEKNRIFILTLFHYCQRAAVRVDHKGRDFLCDLCNICPRPLRYTSIGSIEGYVKQDEWKSSEINCIMSFCHERRPLR